MRFDVLTLFPEMYEPLKASILGKAQETKKIDINVINIRDFSKDKHKKVDYTVYGGGAGMRIKPDVVYDAYNSVKSEKSKVIYLTPQGKMLCQNKVENLAKTEGDLILLCGHYEGIDQRVLDKIVDEEISIGDYVLTGGELPAMVMTDAIVRLIPGVLGNQQSHEDDSFQDGLLEFPQYTRPRLYKNLDVPEVLLSGNHANIDQWRHEQKIIRTWEKRPDLLADYPLTDKDKDIIERYKKQLKNE